MSRQLLALTCARGRFTPTNILTYRLVVPSLAVPQRLCSADQSVSVWWAEVRREGVYLKAFLSECRLYERESRSGHRQLLFVGGLDGSVYYYSRTPVCRIDDIVDTSVMYSQWSVLEADDRLADELKKRGTEVTPIVLSLRDAVAVNRRVLGDCWPSGANRGVNARAMWKRFKRRAALSDLVRVDGLDPYETSVAAALIDNGAATTPEEVVKRIYGADRLARPGLYPRGCARAAAPAFFQFTPSESSEFPLKTKGGSYPGKAFDYSATHEAIVAALAHNLASLGIIPYASRLVDLAIVRNGSALFFEAKSTDLGNLLNQVREGIGQLLEYRFAYRGSFVKIHLSLVISDPGSTPDMEFARGFAEDCGISLVTWIQETSRFDLLYSTLECLSEGTAPEKNCISDIPILEFGQV